MYTFDVALRQQKSQPEHSLTRVSTRKPQDEAVSETMEGMVRNNKNEKWHLKHFPPALCLLPSSGVCVCAAGKVAKSEFISKHNSTRMGLGTVGLLKTFSFQPQP